MITTFDGPGIPPDIAVPVFADAEVAAGTDPAMIKAPEILAKSQGAGKPPPSALKQKEPILFWLVQSV
jgi:hypothetical protein